MATYSLHRDGIQKSYAIGELESALSFSFLPQIAFESLEMKEQIQKRGLEKKDVSQEERRFGETYRLQIESSYLPKASIRFINERVGYGLFAEETIEQGSYVGEYTGVVRRNNRRYFEPLNHYPYRYPVSDHLGIDFVIDATQGHLTRFINHSGKPNLEPFYAFYDGFYHLIFLSCSQIIAGEQLTFDYGPSYWQLRGLPEIL